MRASSELSEGDRSESIGGDVSAGGCGSQYRSVHERSAGRSTWISLGTISDNGESSAEQHSNTTAEGDWLP
jgi:hypothetical protein